MKVSVITRHSVINYGSLLQSLATQNVIENLGHQCEIIDYIRDDETYQNFEKTILKQKPNWYNNPVKRFVYLALRQPESVFAGKRFENERKRLLNLTQLYSSDQELKNHPPCADVYMTGSDQVWGPVVNRTYDSSYCLSFVPNDKKKISYAASFGHTQINEEKTAYFKKWLSEYDDITVREDSAVNILKTMDLGAKQVLDPTLLLSADEWGKYISKDIKGKYVLIYQLHNNPKICEYAKKVAEEKGLPLIRISAYLHQITRPGKFVWCPSMDQFLSYIKNADCMITDSFHGTAFAINFNVSFVEVLPNDNTSTRNVSILNLTGLNDRILKDENDVELALKKPDFTYANKVLQSERKKSLETLAKMIED